ncbi:hypothetical protein L0U85_08060 [Glycomyces sp. L485]|uniref:hypothetical protein n=1 Tax=Glycomyces sp. L485 TaxID=2909235 RepID=UPI001F4B3997|nr:hypothetical protein [Glycomyces sp. L485]MCH7230802.1 hypothetical protein [Glycomyces sp. L485]
MTRTVMPNLFNAKGAVIDTRDGARAALRWMIDPELGLPTTHFKVWHLPKPSTKPEKVDVRSDRAVRDRVLHIWPDERAAAMVRVDLDVSSGRALVRAHSGPSGSGQVVDEVTAAGPATGVGLTLAGASIRSLTTSPNATVTGVVVLDLQRHVDDPGWKLLEHVGLPVDERFSGGYPLDRQGPPGALTDPVKAAVRRVERGTPADFWAPTTDSGLPVPPFEPPDPEALVRGELQPTMEQLAQMLREAGDRGRHARYVLEQSVPVPQSVHGTDAPSHWRSSSNAKLPPLQSALLAAGTDPYAALALGFGTSIDAAALMSAPPAVTHRIEYRSMVSGLLMVTLKHKAEFKMTVAGLDLRLPLEHDLAALVVVGGDPPDRPARLRVNENRTSPRLDRPGGIDRPWLEIVDLTWDADRPDTASSIGASSYAVLGSVGGSELEPALDERPSGGHRVFVPGLSDETDQVRYTRSAVPERFPGESDEARFSVAAQDWFGRWSPWRSVRHDRLVMPPQRPTVRRVEIDESGPAPAAAVEFTWDWADRRPAEVHIGLTVHPEGTTPPDADGSVLSPGGPRVGDHVISFSGASSESPPTGVEEILEERRGELRTYRCTIPGLGLPYAAHPRIRVQARARAAELVRPLALSEYSSPVGTAVASPLPPPAPVTTAPMRWSSLPDAAGVSRAVLDWSGAGPSYTVYVADETAVARELGLPSPDLDEPAVERLADLRGHDFGSARRAFRRHTERLTEPRLEVELPKGNRLIHFYGISSISDTGIERRLPADANRYLAVAAPVRLEPSVPLLLARRDGASVRLSATVDDEPVAAERIEIGRVRGRVNAGTPEAAGAPELIANRTTATADDGKLHWELTDSDPLPPWEPVYYRAVAVASADASLGQVPGRSHPTPAAEVIVPAPDAPTVTGLTVVPASDGSGGAVATFRTDASPLRTRLGAFTVSVVAVRANAGDTETTVLRGEIGSLPSYTGTPPPDAPELFLHRATAADPYRVTARIATVPLSVTASATDPLGRRTSSTRSAP